MILQHESSQACSLSDIEKEKLLRLLRFAKREKRKELKLKAISRHWRIFIATSWLFAQSDLCFFYCAGMLRCPSFLWQASSLSIRRGRLSDIGADGNIFIALINIHEEDTRE